MNKKARPMHPAWARQLRDQCQERGIPFHFKQRGEWSWGENGGLEKAATHIIFQEGAVVPINQIGDYASMRTRPYAISRVGRGLAGRLLDGKEYLQFPKVEAAI